MRKGRLQGGQILLALACAAVHFLLLALVIRAVPPPRMALLGDAQRAVRVTLLPRARPAAQPKPAPTPSRRPPPPRPAHLLPIPRPFSASAPTPLALPTAPATPAPAALCGPPSANRAQAEQAWARLGRAILGHTGCANPDAADLNAAERAACQDRVAQSLARAKTLPLGISPRKQAAFDRMAACQEKYDRGTMPAGTDESQGSRIHGLGYIPKARECAPLGH